MYHLHLISQQVYSFLYCPQVDMKKVKKSVIDEWISKKVTGKRHVTSKDEINTAGWIVCILLQKF